MIVRNIEEEERRNQVTFRDQCIQYATYKRASKLKHETPLHVRDDSTLLSSSLNDHKLEGESDLMRYTVSSIEEMDREKQRQEIGKTPLGRWDRL